MMIHRIVLISLFSVTIFFCDSTLQPEIVAVDGKEYSEVIHPVIEHPKLLTPIDSLKSTFSKQAKLLEFDGHVFIAFTVDSAGIVKDPEIMRGGNDQINLVAKEIVKSAQFEPAKQNGKVVSVRYAIPFKSNW